MDDTEKQTHNRQTEHLKPWQFKAGQSGNPKGRPPGTKSLKEFAGEYLRSLTEEEKLEFMEGLPKDVVWKMAEGNPKNDVDIQGEITKKIISVDE